MSSRLRRSALAWLALAATAIPLHAQRTAGAVVPGITVLLRDSLHLLRGKRVGLITNHTGRDAAGVSSIDLLARTSGVQLVALFGPEHGLRGLAQAGEHVASAVDSATGVPILSLYGATTAPTAAMLENVEVLVYDIQDIGARTYTYAWTMALSAAAAGARGIPFIVCDRPVVVRGDRVHGGVLDTAYRSFVGQYPVAMRYGLTPGELLRHLVRTGQVRANVTVVPMQGWTRSMWYEATGLPWVAPSPNLRTVDAALLYTGSVLVEGTNLSEGRGTEAPFQLVGAPWLTDAPEIAAALQGDARLRGVQFDAVTRTIAAGQKFGGATIPMLRLTVTDRETLDPTAIAVSLLAMIRSRHPTEFQTRAFMDKLAGTNRLRLALDAGRTAEALALPRAWRRASAQFARSTRADRLYR